MNYKIGLLATVTLFAAFVLSGCDSPSNKMEDVETSEIEANRDMEIATSEVEDELRKYRAENADRFKEFNRTTSDIEQQIENESDEEVRNRLETKLDGYEDTQLELKREMDNYKASGKDNWDDFKDSFSNRMDDLGNSLNDFFSTASTNTSSIN